MKTFALNKSVDLCPELNDIFLELRISKTFQEFLLSNKKFLQRKKTHYSKTFFFSTKRYKATISRTFCASYYVKSNYFNCP